MDDLEMLAKLGDDMNAVRFVVPEGVKIASRYYWKKGGSDFARANSKRNEILVKKNSAKLSAIEEVELGMLTEKLDSYIRNDPKNSWVAEQNELRRQKFAAYIQAANRILGELGSAKYRES